MVNYTTLFFIIVMFVRVWLIEDNVLFQNQRFLVVYIYFKCFVIPFGLILFFVRLVSGERLRSARDMQTALVKEVIKQPSLLAPNISERSLM